MILEKKYRMKANRLDKLVVTDKGYLTEDTLRVAEDFLALMPMYRGAMKEVSTKLEVLDEEFQCLYDRNPIHHLECRIKSPNSIAEKMIRRGYPMTTEGLRNNMTDVAGVRVVCNYISDVYSISEMLLKQDDITLVRRRDYIENPKPSGYRSLHLVVLVPVFMSRETRLVPVEVQLRTIAMDMWASLEHELRYKSGESMPQLLSDRLVKCADISAMLDVEMQQILDAHNAPRDN